MPVLPLVASTIGHAGLQRAALLGVPDHGGADPALHRVGRIAALDLGENRGASCSASRRLIRTSGVRPMDLVLSS